MNARDRIADGREMFRARQADRDADRARRAEWAERPWYPDPLRPRPPGQVPGHGQIRRTRPPEIEPQEIDE